MQIPESELKFQYSRSGGKGGQNVNKLETRVTLRWKPSESNFLSQRQIERVLRSPILQTRMNQAGEVVLHEQRERTQGMNKLLVIAKLNDLVTVALEVKKKRRATKPTRASKERRLKAKKQKSQKKRDRNYRGE